MSLYSKFPFALSQTTATAIPGTDDAHDLSPSVNELNTVSNQSSDVRTGSTASASERQAKLTFLESESSDLESGNEQQDAVDHPSEDTSHLHTMYPQRTSSPGPRSCSIPRFSRALTMPLPSQLGYLKHPYRSDPLFPPEESLPPDSSSRIQEMSVELADSVQAMIQTMLQISPPQLLDPAKEQLSACSLSVPASSMSAMLTLMKNLNYISANMERLCSQQSQTLEEKDVELEKRLLDSPVVPVDFDIGELLQSVGDSLSGSAAQAGVDLVLYHGIDIDMRHVSVRGDENGTSYALSHVIRRILETTRPGDSIELGLLLGSIDLTTGLPNYEHSSDLESPLLCTIRISHKFATEFTSSISANKPAPPDRPQPMLSGRLLCRLLHHIGASLVPDLPPTTGLKGTRTCDFVLPLRRGYSSTAITPIVGQLIDEESMAGEPSIEQLVLFAEGLKGKKVTLYASTKGSFAQHLTRYLIAWGVDITHVSPDGVVDDVVESPPPSGIPSEPPPSIASVLMQAENGPSDPMQLSSSQPSFIFIDDDLEVLKERLRLLRSEKSTTLRKRPSLAAYRPRSSPQITRIANTIPSPLPSSVVIVHFTSLSNYKSIKDIVHSIVSSHTGSTAPVPEVMIIPKPAGPRRFLTALYTAMMKPVVDPFFSPIATAPSSPTFHPTGSFFHSYHNPENNNIGNHSTSTSTNNNSPRSVSKTPRPVNSRNGSDRSSKSAKDISELCKHPTPASSPLAISENMEYFPEAAVQLGTSPSSGLVIQSPDGQHAGIFFHPRQKGAQRTPSATHVMERDKGQLQVIPGPEQGGKRSGSKLSVTACGSGGGGSGGSGTYLRTMTASPVSVVSSKKSPRPPFASSSTSSTGSGDGGGGGQGSSLTTPRKRASTGDMTPPRKGSGDGEEVPAKRPVQRRTTVEGSVAPAGVMAAASKKAKAAGDGNIVPPISVLIVDDNPINQTILSAFMRKKGIRFEVACNGQEAVLKWKTGGFHLILMDIQMPVMDGIQATKEIRMMEQNNAAAGYPPGTPSFDDRPPALRTPSESSSTDTRGLCSPYRSSVIIVALTASSLQSDRVAALAAGCNDFLTKPVSLLWLNSKIIEWGSIKALQMWADPRPESGGAVNLVNVQVAQARAVAERLHVPSGKAPGRQKTPSPSRKVGDATGAQMAGGSRGHREGPSPPPSPKTLNELAKDLAQGGRRTSLTPTGSGVVVEGESRSDRPP